MPGGQQSSRRLAGRYGLSSRHNGNHERTAADVPADGGRIGLKGRARRMRCPVAGCEVETFREQVPGVPER